MRVLERKCNKWHEEYIDNYSEDIIITLDWADTLGFRNNLVPNEKLQNVSCTFISEQTNLRTFEFFSHIVLLPKIDNALRRH